MQSSCLGLPGAFAPFIPIAIQTPNNSGRTADQPGIQVSHRFSTNSGAAIALSFTIRMRLMDTLTKRERSERMSRVRGKDTGPELAVRKLAHSMGYRYRLHVRDLPGAPDLVFPRLRNIIRAWLLLAPPRELQTGSAAKVQTGILVTKTEREPYPRLGKCESPPEKWLESEDNLGMPNQQNRTTSKVTQFVPSRSSLKSVELFSGAGGLALGIARAGFEHLAVVEWNPDACGTMRLNQGSIPEMGSWPIYQADVRCFDFKDLPEDIDLLAGGVPCQPFSIGGKHRGHKDERNMFPELVLAVRTLRPKAVLIENVKGLTRPSFAKYFGYIELMLTYPEIARRSGEDWTDHRARLERHHTGSAFHGLHYKVVYRS